MGKVGYRIRPPILPANTFNLPGIHIMRNNQVGKRYVGGYHTTALNRKAKPGKSCRIKPGLMTKEYVVVAAGLNVSDGPPC